MPASTAPKRYQALRFRVHSMRLSGGAVSPCRPRHGRKLSSRFGLSAIAASPTGIALLGTQFTIELLEIE
jgi:hypothetical protein